MNLYWNQILKIHSKCSPILKDLFERLCSHENPRKTYKTTMDSPETKNRFPTTPRGTVPPPGAKSSKKPRKQPSSRTRKRERNVYAPTEWKVDGVGGRSWCGGWEKGILPIKSLSVKLGTVVWQ